jgi:alpha-beta hydrolase superfamily lysophospholipase
MSFASIIDAKVLDSLKNVPAADMSKVYLPPTDEFVINSRGQKIHCRSHFPKDSHPDLLIVKLHGYSVHNNDPFVDIFHEEFLKENIAVVGLDFHGHGYSEGRYLLESYDHLLDDCLSVLFSKYRELKLNCNFAIFGISMGGAVAMACGREMQKLALNSSKFKYAYDDDDSDMTPQDIACKFKGCILICPAISVKLPSELVILILEYFVIPIIPQAAIPDFLSPPDFAMEFLGPEQFHEYFSMNHNTECNGLGKGKKVSFQTGCSVARLFQSLQSSLHEIAFPFVVMHDPKDQVVPIEGTLRLMAESSTPSRQKEFIPMPDGGHALLPTRMGTVIEKAIHWIKEQRLTESVAATTASSDSDNVM